MLPQCTERLQGSLIVDELEEPAKPLALRSAEVAVPIVVNVDVQFRREELREGGIGEVEDVPRPRMKSTRSSTTPRSKGRKLLMPAR
jgi:hypothetical protein